MTNRSLRFVLLALLASIALLAAACSSDGKGDGAEPDTDEADGEEEAAGFEGDLVGLFEITAGECADAGVTSGSYFKMVLPGGTVEDGPFFPNEADSPCGDPSFTPLQPGTDGGLRAGDYQPAPDPAFDDAGNGLGDLITTPATFAGTEFSTATEEDGGGAAPQITATDGTLSGEISAFTAFYAGVVFNQGAPKPDGSLPGLTMEVSGMIDPDTGEYVLDWVSQIANPDSPFNNFTGVWHLEGTFAA